VAAEIFFCLNGTAASMAVLIGVSGIAAILARPGPASKFWKNKPLLDSSLCEV
jgi:hypothetical protein